MWHSEYFTNIDACSYGNVIRNCMWVTQSELESRLSDLQTQKHEMDVLLNELHTMREGKQAL